MAAAAAYVDIASLTKLAQTYETQQQKMHDSSEYKDYKEKLDVLISALLKAHQRQPWIDKDFINGQVKHHLKHFGTLIANTSKDHRAADELRSAYETMKASSRAFYETKKTFREAVSHLQISREHPDFEKFSPLIKDKITRWTSTSF